MLSPAELLLEKGQNDLDVEMRPLDDGDVAARRLSSLGTAVDEHVAWS